MYRDRIKFIIIIIVCALIFAAVVFFGYKIIAEGKSFGQAISDITSSNPQETENQTETNQAPQTPAVNGFNISEISGYANKNLSGDKAKELLNIVLQKYLVNVANGQKKGTSMILILSNNKSNDQKHLKEMKSLIDTYIYIVLGKNPTRETYNVYFEMDKNGDQKLRIIDNKDALDTINS